MIGARTIGEQNKLMEIAQAQAQAEADPQVGDPGTLREDPQIGDVRRAAAARRAPTPVRYSAAIKAPAFDLPREPRRTGLGKAVASVEQSSAGGKLTGTSGGTGAGATSVGGGTSAAPPIAPPTLHTPPTLPTSKVPAWAPWAGGALVLGAVLGAVLAGRR